MSILDTAAAHGLTARASELIALISRHRGQGGYCPICQWTDGRHYADPCDILLEARLEFEAMVTPDVDLPVPPAP